MELKTISVTTDKECLNTAILENSTGPKLPLEKMQEKDVQCDEKDTMATSSNFIQVFLRLT